MARERDRDEPLIPSWDGEISGWADYSRRVRLAAAQTPMHKRYTLGPKLVLKLREKAWEIAASVDFQLLSQSDGAQYLLSFLKSRLGRLPIPDLGQHLEELFVKLRRQQGTDLISWCQQLREAYRKLQRSMARTKVGVRHQSTQTDALTTERDSTEGTSPSSSAKRRQSMSEPHHEPPSPTLGAGPSGVDRPTAQEQADDEVDANSMRAQQDRQWEDDRWSSHSSSGWGWRQWHGCSDHRWDWHDKDDGDSAFAWEDWLRLASDFA